MIHKVTIINFLGEELTMDLANPEKSGFAIFDITGLGPEKAEIRIADVVAGDGGFYNSARLPPRNIVMSIRFLGWDGKDVETIRQETYKYFPVKKHITLVIETDNRVSEIEGYVESNEPVIFSKEVYTQLSIICPFPYFVAKDDRDTIFYGVEPIFEFPYYNNSVTEPLTIFGNIQNSTEAAIWYPGDADTGMTITIDATGPVGDITIYNLDSREKMTIHSDKLLQMTGEGIILGDRITICTVRGGKSITLLRNGEFINILNVLGRGTDWLQLVRGDNIFGFEASQGIENIIFVIKNRILYEGI